MAKKASNAKKAQPKSPVKRSTRRKRERTAIERKKRNYRVEAIIYAAAALISLFLIIIRGATVWSFFRGVFFGLLGVASILVPLTFAYLTVITALEKEIARFKTKVFMCIAIIFLAETAVYLICEHHFVEDNSIGYFADLGKLFGEAYMKSRAFREMLTARTEIPVVLWAERRSSVEAHQILHLNGRREKKHRATVDAVAASLILESFLGSPAGAAESGI